MAKNVSLSRREQNKIDKRERLLAASLQLFREKGYEQTKVSEITAAAGVAKGTFFNYFPTKEQVLLALGGQMLGKIEMSETKELFGRDHARDKVKILFRSLASGLDADRELIREMIYRGLRLPDLISRERARFDFRSMLVLLLQQGQRQGEVRRDTDLDFVSDTLYTLYFQQVVTWCSSDFKISLTDRLDQVADLIFDGIAATG